MEHFARTADEIRPDLLLERNIFADSKKAVRCFFMQRHMMVLGKTVRGGNKANFFQHHYKT